MRSPDGNFFDVAWDRDDLDVPYSVVARLDAGAVSTNLKAFVWRIIGLTAVIAVFVTVVTIMIVGYAIFSPLLRLRAVLQKVGDDPDHPDRYVINTSRKDEWGDVVKSFNGMIRRISDSMKHINRQNEDSRAAKKESDDANRTKSLFLSNMSHELRTPLNAILGFSQFLEQHPKETLTKNQREYVGYILTAGYHLQDLIGQVLDLAKIESGKVTLTLEDLDAEKVIDECLGMVQSSAESSGIAVRHVCGRCDEEPVHQPFIRADYIRLKEVLLNLLSNAVKYNRQNGEIIVSCRETAGFMLRIEVRDTGNGIPDKFHNDLFEPFSRFGPSTNAIEGTGIGLTITKQLVKLMDGQIGFNSKVGVGTTFWVDLPLSTR